MIAENSSARAPLERLWLVYIHHFDLRRAMPVDDPDTPQRLLWFAAHDARIGSFYDRGLKEFGHYFVALPES
jgi:hypothetical protein